MTSAGADVGPRSHAHKRGALYISSYSVE